jgi:hypothetical protein
VSRDTLRIAGARELADRHRFRVAPPKGRAASEAMFFDAVALVEGERFAAALGRNAEAAVTALIAARSGRERLGAQPEAAGALRQIDPEAAFAVFADLGPLAPPAPASGALLVASGGRRESEHRLRLELSDRAFETLIRWGIAP